MITIVHISDLHFGREQVEVIDQLINALARIEPNCVIVSGDITQRARKSEFVSACAFLNSLRWPKLIISGNHDIPAFNLIDRFINPWRKWHLYTEYELEPVQKGTGFIAIGINTARRFGALFDWSRGRINEEQTNTIATQLRTVDSESLRLVVAHHPFWLPEKYKERRVVGGRDGALAVMKKSGVDIILSGHVHSAYTKVVNGIIICHAGSAISDRLDADSSNSFQVIYGNRQKLTIVTHEWQAPCLVPTKQRFYKRFSDAWLETSSKHEETA
jgi:3',5'-cyclic AMP phosphodiesterase CpdA